MRTVDGAICSMPGKRMQDGELTIFSFPAALPGKSKPLRFIQTSSAPTTVLWNWYGRFRLGNLRTNRQDLAAKDFISAESSGSKGILCVLPSFRTARMGQKIRRPAEDDLFRVSFAHGFPKTKAAPHDFACRSNRILRQIVRCCSI